MKAAGKIATRQVVFVLGVVQQPCAVIEEMEDKDAIFRLGEVIIIVVPCLDY